MTIARFALAAASALALTGALGATPALAQDGMILSGTVEETFGADGFIIVFDGQEVAIATGELADDNPGFEIEAGTRVTVFTVPTAEFFADRIVDADAVFVDGSLARVSRPALSDRFYERQGRAASAATDPDARMTFGEDEAEVTPEEQFGGYDSNGDGVVTLPEYVRVASEPDNVTRAQAVRLFEALARGDRVVTRKEFIEPSRRFEELSDRYLTPPSE